ncbi:putative cytochrome P450 hydroxylase [Cystobacter fuscus DSM 2262]|uniref:Cytochrome P450 hydroxylase n=1 Tax=Cystobacter fuscus (strain ATCC 25194 / DSM 2262 / NBRC 100088 / M29) TaxID=1242864 RepID=S9P6J8_CYSF2|nr:putative cytochrome P450 hydroxylase [Cystobacter fuscus DSM 2262]
MDDAELPSELFSTAERPTTSVGRVPSPTNSDSSLQGLSLNPISPENLVNPIPLYKALRETEPVYWSDTLHAWLVTRYVDVMGCFRDPRLSANRTNFYEQQLQGLGGDVAGEFLKSARLQMTMRDGADHIRVRRQASPGFTPQGLDAYRPAIRQFMGMLLDRVQEWGHMDVVKEISYQLPPLVIAEFLNIPPQDRERFQAWARPLADFANPKPGVNMQDVAREASRVTVEMNAYLAERIEERRHHPGNDMLSLMIHAQELGRMTEDDLAANTLLILTAGHLTTTDQISNGVYDLLSHPEQRQKLQKDRTLLRSAVEEMLRFSPAVPFAFRVAAEDFTLHGKNIRKGDTVFIGLASANRDPSVFTDPDTFDITRDSVQQKHLTFAFGAHHCLGAGLARREMEIATEMLLDRLPEVRLDKTKEPEYKVGLVFRSFNSLHLEW